jgi:hypothetical protein
VNDETIEINEIIETIEGVDIKIDRTIKSLSAKFEFE